MRRSKTNNRIWALVLTAALIASLLIPMGGAAWQQRTAHADEDPLSGDQGLLAYVNYSPALNVRVAPGSGEDQLLDKDGNPVQLTTSTIVRVLEDVTYVSGSVTTYWKKIKFDYHGEKDMVGYVMAATDENKITYLLEFDKNYIDPDFEAEMEKEGFPESYREILRAVHQWNPTWTFKAQHLDVDWNEAINEEYDDFPTLNNSRHPSGWKSLAQGDYRYAVDDGNGGLKDGGWKLNDGKYARASKEMLAYAMDPRNFLGESTIFMFEDLDYLPDVQTEEGVKRILNKYKDFKGSTEGFTYSQLFMEAARESGVNPYFLATRSVHEVNNSLIIAGNGIAVNVNGETVIKYPGIYNYYNFSAYAGNGMGVIEHGLNFASHVYTDKEKSSSSFYDDLRPWNTRRKAIVGGAKRLGREYVKVGQNTPYLQRYNVAPSNPKNRYSHQYMSLVTALYEESYMYYSGLMEDGDGAINTPYVFLIPVYKNMPETPCERPTGDGNPNPYLADLTITGEGLEEGTKLSPEFEWDKDEYSITVEEPIDKITVSASPLAKTTKISGTGEYLLVHGETVCEIECKAENGTVVKYMIRITRKGEGEDPSVTPKPSQSVTPSVSPEVSPSVSPEVSPSVSPEVTPSVSPGVVPSVSPEVTPSVSPEVTPSVSPEVTPTDTPTPTPTDTPTPTPTNTPTPTPEPEKVVSEKYQVSDEYICNIEPGTEMADFLSEIKVTGGSRITMLNAKGEEVTEGTVGTGWTLKTKEHSIPIIIFGDVTGDGDISAIDLLYIRRHLLEISTLSGAALIAADVKNDEEITALDLLYVKRHILDIAVIVQKR